MATPGFRIRLHSSLVTPILLGGAPRRFAIINGTLCAAFVLGLQAFYTLPLFVVFHLVAVFMAKKDPFFFDVLLRHFHQKKYYNV